MPETRKQETEISDRSLLISKLVDPNTPLEERIVVSRELFPEERKREILAEADKDIKGRPVRYFRWMSYEELGAILISSEANPIKNPEAEKDFLRKGKEMQYFLKKSLEEKGIYKEFETDFEKLCADFTLDNYRNFIQKRLPRATLLRMHRGSVGGYGSDVTGLKSLSVGAPFVLPVDPFKGRAGTPVVEFSIPTERIFVSPSSDKLPLQESEKEVNALELKPEWIVDVYNGTQDLSERFIKDPTSVLYPEYQKEKEKDSLINIYDYVGEESMWDILNRWKHSEPTSDLVPTQKLSDLEGTNPDLKKPLVSE